MTKTLFAIRDKRTGMLASIGGKSQNAYTTRGRAARVLREKYRTTSEYYEIVELVPKEEA